MELLGTVSSCKGDGEVLHSKHMEIKRQRSEELQKID